MQIVIPMAGVGTRYKEAGFKEIKPLIKVNGKPMIEYVLKLFPWEKNFVFICNEQHLKTTSLSKILHRLKPTAKIVAIKPHKLGPVETVLRALDSIDDSQPTIINYCDFFMDWSYDQFKRLVKQTKIDGAIICYKGFHPHLLHDGLYAGVKTDKANNFLETREKFSYTANKMESWQSAGCYYFRTGAIAKKYLREVKQQKLITNNEYYIPWAYNLMKKDGLKIIVYPCEQFCQWGTPEDLAEYLYWSKYFLK